MVYYSQAYDDQTTKELKAAKIPLKGVESSSMNVRRLFGKSLVQECQIPKEGKGFSEILASVVKAVSAFC